MKREDEILASVKQEYQRYCMFCGHTISFYAFEPTKKLCHYCHRYTYKDDKSKFLDKLNIERKKLK